MKIIATAGKGGTGKTTILAWLLARHLLSTSRRVLVVDADPHQGLTSLLANLCGLGQVTSLGELRQQEESRLRFGTDLQGASQEIFG